ncbi:MAG: LLM class flavin-dependent oxidoreductase [Chloroflexi bacterium]|nr:LLM class flavin-dependent oxidoreductase [Chloroflexota bacterium]
MRIRRKPLPGYVRWAAGLAALGKAAPGKLDELWVVEDCFYASGMASAAVALAVTDPLQIGLGIMPAVVRNPAFSAMEIATLARMYPGRFLPGIGHGMADWMRQIGAFPKSQLAALGETTEAVRRLLAGEEVTMHGSHVHLDRVKLEFPPTQPPPITLGVRGPRSLHVSGRSADGTLLAELSSPAYVRWARQEIRVGQQEARREDQPHRVTVYALLAVDDDAAAARTRMRKRIAPWLVYGQEDYTRALGIEAEVNEMRMNGGVARLEAEMKDDWIDQMAAVGTASDCAASVQRLAEAGADSVVLVTEQLGEDGLADVEAVLSALG